jgi:formylmethanofuran dehydrogenase subunit B
MSSSPVAAAEQVRKIAAAAFEDALLMLALIEVLETGNEHAVVKAINAAEAVRAAQLVRHALFAHLHILVSRAYSRARDRDLHAQRAFDLLTEPAVRAKVAEKGIEDR